MRTSFPLLLRATRRHYHRRRYLLILLFLSLLLFLSFPFRSPLNRNGKVKLLQKLSVTHSALLAVSPLFDPYPTCLSHLLLSSHRLNCAEMSLNPNAHLLDARAYLSAALQYQYDCFNYLSNLNKSTLVESSLFSAITELFNLTADALSVVNNYVRFGSEFSPVKRALTEREGFYESPAVLTPKKISAFSLFPKSTRPNVTVCKNTGSCDYTSIHSAILSAPNYSSTQFIIHSRYLRRNRPSPVRKNKYRNNRSRHGQNRNFRKSQRSNAESNDN